MSVFEKKYHRISLGHKNNALVMLIAICMILFIALAFLKAMMYLRYREGDIVDQHFQSDLLSWVALPAGFSGLLAKPWTILTHSVVHARLLDLVANMLWLWCFGYILQDLTGNRKLFPIFFYGMLAGGLAFLVVSSLAPGSNDLQNSQLFMGASAGIMAIALAVTTIAPGFRLFPMINGGIPIWILTMIYVILDLVTIPIGNPGFHIAHLAGGLAGFLFIFFLRKGYDGSNWINNFFDWVTNLFNPDKPLKGKSIKDELFYKSVSSPYSRTPNVTQRRIDEILEKVHEQGYKGLSDEEKDLLKRASNEDL